jgi:uncharacterized protein YndB with AHSA1/START domain
MTLTVERTSPTTLVCRRSFAAPPARLWQAHTDPALIERWCFGFDGWTVKVTSDLRVGGGFRWDFAEAGTGNGFYFTGTYLELDAPHRMVHVERWHMPDPSPDNTIETRFDAEGTGTRMTLTMSVAESASMDAMVATGMTDGMEVTYARIDGL